MSAFLIIAGIAAILAIFVTAAIVGACLGVSWVTDIVRGQPRQGMRGNAPPPTPPAAGGRPMMPPATGSRPMMPPAGGSRHRAPTRYPR
jgi:hypothetical protein